MSHAHLPGRIYEKAGVKPKGAGSLEVNVTVQPAELLQANVRICPAVMDAVNVSGGGKNV